MIYAFLAILGLLGVYATKDKEEITKNMQYIMVFICMVFLFSDAYVYVMLPWQLSQFYNNGAGVSYVNSQGNVTTAYSSTDPHVMYFQSWISQDFTFMELLKYFAYLVFGLFLLFYAGRILGQFTSIGEKVS